MKTARLANNNDSSVVSAKKIVKYFLSLHYTPFCKPPFCSILVYWNNADAYAIYLIIVIVYPCAVANSSTLRLAPHSPYHRIASFNR